MVTKRNFARVVKEHYESALSMANIQSGYAKCGIFPLNRKAIPQLKLLPSEYHFRTLVSSNVWVTISPIAGETDNESCNELIGESMHEVTVASSAGDQNTESPSNDIQDHSMSLTSPSTSRPISSTPIVYSTPSATANSTETPCSETPHSETPCSCNISVSQLSNTLV